MTVKWPSIVLISFFLVCSLVQQMYKVIVCNRILFRNPAIHNFNRNINLKVKSATQGNYWNDPWLRRDQHHDRPPSHPGQVCDNMPFASHTMAEFADSWGFQITTSSPRYAQSNSQSEKFVGIVKSFLRNAHEQERDPHYLCCNKKHLFREQLYLSV